MAIAQPQNDTEKKKMIIAGVLGAIALLSLIYAFGGGFFSSRTNVAVTTSTPSPTATPSRASINNNLQMPTRGTQDFTYQSTPVVYSAGIFSAPDPGRNIFAFYEPPPPCTPGVNCPTPTPYIPPPATPAPTPPIFVAYVTPQSVYEGSRGFKLDVFGDKFDPTTKVYFNNAEMATNFISPQRMSIEVPANLVMSSGSASILVRTPDGKLYSNPVMLSVQAKPLPQFKYIGMIGRQHANNDTAYLLETGKQAPTTFRLSDVIGGRFRLVSISPENVVVEDTGLGFRHSIKLEQPTAGAPVVGGGLPTGPIRGGGRFPNSGVIQPPVMPQGIPDGSIPGIPDNIPRVTPGANVNTRPVRNPDKKDEDGDEDGRRR